MVLALGSRVGWTPARKERTNERYSILGTKIRFFYYRLSADARNWFRQASSTDNESSCASSTRWRFAGGPVCSSASRFSLAASAAAVVHSSNSHCLAHTSFGAPNSCPGCIVDQRLLRRRTGAHQLRRDKADIKRHPATDMLRGGPTDKQGKRLPVSPTCELKATHQQLKSDTHWWNWLCFQQAYIKASNHTFTVQTRYTHTAYWHWSPVVRGAIKGMIVGTRGEGN